MSKYSKCNTQPDCGCSSPYNIVTGNSLDVDVNYCEAEIRADVVVSEYNSVRLWGRVVNCDGKPIANALIKLLKVTCCGDHQTYAGIAHTISDCEGFYQFELCSCDDNGDSSCYRILVSKAAYGPERVISPITGNCDPCNPDSSNGPQFDPCKEYPSVIAPPSECCDDYKGNCGCNSNNYYSKSRY